MSSMSHSILPRSQPGGSNNVADLSVSLQFVINNEPHLPNSRENRRTVKSHVMRKYRAIRKIQNTMPPRKLKLLQKVVSKTPDCSEYTSKFVESKTPDDRDSQHHIEGKSKSPLGEKHILKAEEPLRVDTGGGSCSDSDRSRLSSFRKNVVTATPPRSSSCEQRISVPEDCVQPQDAQNMVPVHSSNLNTWLSNISSPYILFQDEGAPMLRLNAQTWPFPRPVRQSKPKSSIFMPSRTIPVSDWSSPRGFWHGSAIVIPFVLNTEEYFKFKVDTIQWINKRLGVTSQAVHDATIGSILLLLNFELMRGDVTEALCHMNGMQEIARFRGGLAKMYDRNIIARVLTIDLLVAVLSTTPPRFSIPTLLPVNLLGPAIHIIPDSPLTTTKILKSALAGSPLCDTAIKCLQRMQTLTRLVRSGVSSAKFGNEIQSSGKSGNLKFLEIIQYTSEIYSRALQTPPVPFSSPSNRKLNASICQAVESPVNDHIWEQIPGIFSWVLLVGCAAAEKASAEHHYFMSLLIKAALGAGHGWMAEWTETANTFIFIKARAERWEGRGR